jgi:hypothetical protein
MDDENHEPEIEKHAEPQKQLSVEKGEGGGGDDSPGNAFKQLILMEEVLDKLKLMKYENELVKTSGPLRKPISQ